MTNADRVAAARRRLFTLENDNRILAFEVENAYQSVLGGSRPTTLAQAHRLIDELEATLHRATTEVPW